MNKGLIEPPDIRLKRLRFRSSHRGCKETDLVLGAFAEARLESLDAAMLTAYERLLEESDADIWDWLVGRTSPHNPAYSALIVELRRYNPQSSS